MNRRVRPPEGEVIFGIHAGRARIRRHHRVHRRKTG
jgi:hypothetical protein